MKDSAIIGFWDWFRQESEALKTIATGKEEIAKSLSSQLNSIVILNWEIGHQRDSLVYFALSAEIDEDRLIFNQYAASLCDPIPVGWTILSSIPPKQWDGVMIWDGLNVNTNDWEFGYTDTQTANMISFSSAITGLVIF
ncbi:MAG: hypothetical protein HZY74_08605 [Brevundimonas sp.]|nr:MAG: hypothetical protein HZY74_08605 [Brevundimonas sp.]